MRRLSDWLRQKACTLACSLLSLCVSILPAPFYIIVWNLFGMIFIWYFCFVFYFRYYPMFKLPALFSVYIKLHSPSCSRRYESTILINLHSVPKDFSIFGSDINICLTGSQYYLLRNGLRYNLKQSLEDIKWWKVANSSNNKRCC